MHTSSKNHQIARSSGKSSGQMASAGPQGLAISPPVDGIKSIDQSQELGYIPQTVVQTKKTVGAADGTEDSHVLSGQERNVPHEAWHVVQQKQKQVQAQPTIGDAAQRSDYRNILQSQRPDSPIAQNGTIIQMRATWGINESARRHYDDDWGEAYGITSDNDLKDAIIDEANWDEGNQRVDLGVFNPSGVRGAARDCYIRYRNSYDRNPDGHTYTWHCGPAL